MKAILFLIFVFLATGTHAQLSWSGFSWKGSTSDYKTTGNQSLFLNSQSGESPAIISAEVSSLDTVATWTFSFIYNSSVSSSNYMRVFLSAADSTLQDGINVTFGTADKNISLVQTIKGRNYVLIRGEKGVLNDAPKTVSVSVQRFLNVNGSYHYILCSDCHDATVYGECDVAASKMSAENCMGVYTRFTSGRSSNCYGISSIELGGGLVEKPTVVDVDDFYRGCVVINEIMANPSGQLGLPNHEYVELHNTADVDIDIYNWTVENATACGVVGNCVIPAGGYVTLCSKAHVDDFSAVPNVFPVSPWPSLSNASGRLVLRNQHSRVADYADYSSSAFGSSYKKDGGWSLERVDPYNLSGDASLWKPSLSSVGGTPSATNSILSDNIDVYSPFVQSITSGSDGSSLYVSLSEPIDTATVVSSIVIGGIHYDAKFVVADDVTLSRFSVHLSEPIQKGRVYEVSGLSMSDFAGNPLLSDPLRTAISTSVSSSSHIIINEIMANASPSSGDFVEFFNYGNETYNMNDICFGQIKDTTLTSCIPFTKYSRLFFPGDYVVLCCDSLKHVEVYSPHNPEWVVGNAKFANLPAEGSFAVTTVAGDYIDQLAYDDKLHSLLLADLHNVSLERINSSSPTNSASNWTSAAEYNNFATPTECNSQNRDNQDDLISDIEVTTRKFSPDGDGFDDEMILSAKFGDAQWNATLKVFSAQGELVAVPYNNRPMPVSGELRWDGRSDNGQIQSPGTYILYISAWSISGHRKEYMKTCVLLPSVSR